MTVLLFPPRESWSNLVSLESRYGTCNTLRDRSPRADITFPKAKRPQFIDMPSFARSPVAPAMYTKTIIVARSHQIKYIYIK